MATGGEGTGGDGAAVGLSGWRWRATLVVLGLAALLDVFFVVEGGAGTALALLALLVFTGVCALAVHGLRGGGDRLLRAASQAAALSFIGSAGLAIAAVGSGASVGFGFVEGTALTLLLVACWRRAASRGQQAVAGAVTLAVVALPTRLGLVADTATFEALAVAVTALAVATGSVLRSADASHHAAVTAVRRAEREEVARELHDIVAHHVTGMVVLTQAARTVANRSDVLVPAGAAPPPGTVPSMDDALAAIELAGAQALASLRSMVTVLRTPEPDDSGGPPLEPSPVVEDLQEMVSRFRRSGAADRVDLVMAPDARTLPPQVQAVLVRVVQESLTNASRYARGARSVHVDLACSKERVVLTVCDSGGRAGGVVAPDGARWGGGFGITGMRERVAALGGTLTAGPTPDPNGRTGGGGPGWTVRAQVPA